MTIQDGNKINYLAHQSQRALNLEMSNHVPGSEGMLQNLKKMQAYVLLT